MLKIINLLFNFFVVKPSNIDEMIYIGDIELLVYIKEKLIELIKADRISV